MKRTTLILLIMLAAIALLAGCGQEATGTGAAAIETAPPAADSIHDALAKARDGLVKIKRSGKNVTATYDISGDTYWDDNAIVRELAVDSVDVLTSAFAFPGVKRVNVVFITTMTDEFGNESKEEGVRIEWTRSLWENVQDPEAFKDRLMGDNTLMYQLATWHYVHPGIWKNTKLSDQGIGVEGGQL
jgi:hypothetical protein